MAKPEQTAADLINVKELKRRTGTSESFWNKARLTGSGPQYLKIGSRVLYDWPTVEAWLQSRVRRSTSEQAA